MSDAIYNKDGRLIARDGYIVPLRIGTYLLDSPFGDILHQPAIGTDPLHENMLCMGIDTISWRDTYPGGTVEKGETLEDAGFGEDKEECGSHRNPIPVHSRILSFLSGMHGDNTAYVDSDGWVRKSAVGQEWKLRNVIRTKCDQLPVQQPIKPKERYPEVLRPHYGAINPFDASLRVIRPSFAYAIKKADELNMLYQVIGHRPVKLDYDQLATDWERRRIHPAIIQFYCQDYAGYQPAWRRQQMVKEMNDNPTLDALLDNLEYSELGLHNLLRKKLAHDEVIRELLKT